MKLAFRTSGSLTDFLEKCECVPFKKKKKASVFNNNNQQKLFQVECGSPVSRFVSRTTAHLSTPRLALQCLSSRALCKVLRLWGSQSQEGSEVDAAYVRKDMEA